MGQGNTVVINIEGREEEYADLCAKAGDQENLNILPSSFYREYSWKVVRLFMHENALYTLPTTELIEFLAEKIGLKKAIEIGCGSGHIAKALNIPATDLKVQDDPAVRLIYKMSGQPLIIYPDHVKKMEAVDAVKRYKPRVVVASYITKPFDGKDGNMYAPDEKAILKRISKYIHIGDLNTHHDKPLMRRKYDLIQPDWLIVRGKRGFIGIWK